MNTLLQDVRYGLRMLAKNPGFTAVAVLSLALGIGANSTVFSIVDNLFIRPWPVKDPAALVTVSASVPKETQFEFSFSYPNYLDIRSQVPAFSGVLAHGERGGYISGAGQGEEVTVSVVSENYFTVLGVKAAMGRTFSTDSSQSTAEGRAVVISYGLWQRRYGGDPSLPGKPVLVDGKDFTVIGVAPREFQGLSKWEPIDIWVTPGGWVTMTGAVDDFQSRKDRWFEVMGRLQEDASLEQARTQLQVLSDRLDRALPDSNRGVGFHAVRAVERMRERLGHGLLLMAMVGMVLLISCVNVANLLLAQTERQQREIAMRVAMGASRWHLVRLLLAESLVLALAGESVALLLSSWLIRVVPALAPISPIQLGTDLQLDSRVFLFTTALTLVTALIFGLAPGLRARKLAVYSVLKGETAQGGRSSGFPLRSVLVAGEVGLSVVLLVGSGLLLRTLMFSQRINPGFDTHKNVLMLSVAPPEMYGYDEKQTSAFVQSLLDQIQVVPGVIRASFARRPPLADYEGGETKKVVIPGVIISEDLSIRYNTVSPGFFPTMGTRFLKGRDFNQFDTPTTLPVVIINETMARQFWPGEEPVGRSIQIDGKARQIVGVVESGKYVSLRQTPEPYLFLPSTQVFTSERVLFVETANDPRAAVQSIVKQAQAVDKKLPIVSAITMPEYMRNTLSVERSMASLLGGLSLLGIFLAAVGLYGVVAYLVSRRTHEIGIRMALGARRADVLKLVLGQGLRLSAAGAAIGLVAAMAASRLMSSFLYGVRPTDPLCYVASILVAVSVALLASYFPARRAMKVDPVVALRYE
ncbi:MAG: ABC transporter permease [Terriglobia bacterium]